MQEVKETSSRYGQLAALPNDNAVFLQNLHLNQPTELQGLQFIGQVELANLDGAFNTYKKDVMKLKAKTEFLTQ